MNSTRRGFVLVLLVILFTVGITPAFSKESGQPADLILWDSGATGLQGWEGAVRLQAENRNGILILNINGKDSWLTRPGLQLDTRNAEAIEIRYRARNFTVQKTGGELFYVNEKHGIDGHYYFSLPSLVLDGEWHTLRLVFDECSPKIYNDWIAGGPVNWLRLDIVNEAPGTVEIESMRITFKSDEIHTGKVLWAPGRKDMQGWKDPHNLRPSNVNGLLSLEITGKDSHLVKDRLWIDPSRVNTFVIRYRASGFADSATSGQIFYQNARHKWVERNHLKIPPLTLDGNWHDLEIDVHKRITDYEDWLSGGPITALRLDMVDQAPGRIEIEFIWASPSLRLHVTSTDQVIIDSPRTYLIPLQSFKPSDTGQSERTVLLPKGNYYIWARIIDVAYTENLLKQLTLRGGERVTPTLKNSGDYIWVRVGRTTGGAVTFTMGKFLSPLIDTLLVVEGNQAPHDAPVEIKESAVKSTIEPIVNLRKHILRPYWKGYMLACPSGKTRSFFRRTVDVPADMTSAWLQISVDDYYRLYLNGEKIAENMEVNSWMTPLLIDITAKMRKGEANIFAIEAINAGGPMGLLFDLVLNRKNHSSVRVVSDEQWRCSSESPEGWTQMTFNDTAWLKPTLQPGPPNPPWSVEIPYYDKTWQVPTECVSCKFRKMLQAGEPQEVTLRIRSEKPVVPGEVLSVSLFNVKTGKSPFLHREFVLTEANCKPEGRDTVVISGILLPISKWYASMDIRMEFAIYGRELSDSPYRAVTFHYENNLPMRTLESHVKVVNGVPRLFVNGKQFYPVIGKGVPGNPDMKEDFKQAGCNVYAIKIEQWPSPKVPWWKGPGDYDFASVDAAIIEALDQNPDVLILPIVWSAPRPWWQKQNFKETALFNDGNVWPSWCGISTPSFSSDKWRQEAADALTAFVKHVESAPYGSRILGYWVGGGVTSEWQGWGCHGCAGTNRLMDYSKPAQDGFRKFLQHKYPDRSSEYAQAEVPPLAERLKGELGVFRDPATAQLSIDFIQYYSDSVVEAMLHCLGAVKKAVNGKKIVGAYFGYSKVYTNMAWALQMSGHNSVRKALDSIDMDFFSAPPSYAVRRIDQDVAWMWAFKSIQNAGKLVWPDDDTRTHRSGVCEYSPAVNPDQTRAILRRNYGKVLCRECPQCIMPLVSGREIADAETARDIRVVKRAGEYAWLRNVARKAEIAVVVDEDSVKYLTMDKTLRPSGEVDRIILWNGKVQYIDRKVNTLMGDLISYQQDRIARIGAPVDYILYSDLKKRPLDYKLYIMLSCFQYDDATLKAVQKQIQNRNTTVLWCYAPGFIHGSTADVRNMERLTGIRFGMIREKTTPRTDITNCMNSITATGLKSTSFGADYGIAPLFYVDDEDAEELGVYHQSGKVSFAVKKVGNSRSIFCGSHKLPADLLRSIAASSGVHLYSDSFDPMDANENFLMTHTTSSGKKTIRMKRRCDVVDVYEGKVLFKNVKSFTIDVPKEETRLFFMGDSAKFLRYMDYARIFE